MPFFGKLKKHSVEMRIKLLTPLILMGIFFACSSGKDHLITFETRHGNIHAVLYDETPEHKENFIRLAEESRFDSTEFHRIIPGFMIQGGDVFGKEGLPPEEWYTLPAEILHEYIHEKGSIAAARQGDGINPSKRSSGSQFYIIQGVVYDQKELNTDMQKLQNTFMKYLQLESNQSLRDQYAELYQQREYDAIKQFMLDHKEQLENFFNLRLDKKLSAQQVEKYTTIGGTPHLDGEYTVFGKVIKGFDVIDRIAAEETSAQDKPINPVYMKVTVNELSREKITETYGYKYPQK